MTDHKLRTSQPLILHAVGNKLGPSPIRTYWVPRWILDRAWQILRQDGLKEVESTILWGGRRFGEDAVVMASVYPCGRDVVLERGFVHVGSDTTAEMGRWLRAQGLTALIQLHTHPGAWTGHSRTDDDFSIASSEGFVSLVWPDYGARPARGIEDLGVHRLVGGRWHDVEGEEATTLVRIIESEVMIQTPALAQQPARDRSRRDTPSNPSRIGAAE